jgi:hypothetical protein
MGCDIHLYSEYRKNGKAWKPADAWVFDDRWREGKKEWRIPTHLQPFSDRDYDFFGWLADVRNGTWGAPMPVVTAPRGIPADVSKRLERVAKKWNGDGHSHSWLTLAELESAWEKTKDVRVDFNAAVNPSNPEIVAWLALPEETRGRPTEFCASGGGPRGEYPRARWHRLVKEEIGESYRKLHDYLWNVRFEFGVTDADVRVVFWFDN